MYRCCCYYPIVAYAAVAIENSSDVNRDDAIGGVDAVACCRSDTGTDGDGGTLAAW